MLSVNNFLHDTNLLTLKFSQFNQETLRELGIAARMQEIKIRRVSWREFDC